MPEITKTAQAFFEACETGKGWAGCQAYCSPNASFAAQAEPLADVKTLAESGVNNLAIVTPGFTADCLETLEEIAGENAEFFHHAGGENFAAIPCLNDSAAGMAVIAHVVLRELKGWIDR